MTLTSSVSAHCASEMMPSGEDGKSAAVLMRMSMPPKRRIVASSAARMAARSRMSMEQPSRRSLRPYFAWTSLATASAPLTSRSATITWAPRSAARSATSRPMPLPPPTIMSDAAAELFLRRLAANLGLFERPVLDAEGFAGRKSDVVVVDGEDVRRDAAEAGLGTSVQSTCCRQARLRLA